MAVTPVGAAGAPAGSVTVQSNVSVSVSRPSETVTVTACTPALVPDSVPLMTPVLALIDTPAGRPVAL